MVFAFRKSCFLMLAWLLVACSPADPDKSATIRVKNTATFEINGEIKRFYNVVEVTYYKIGKSALGYGGGVNVRGEALVIPLPDGRKMFMPHVYDSGKRLRGDFASQVFEAFKLPKSIGSIDKEIVRQIRSLKGYVPYVRRAGRSLTSPVVQPTFWEFDDQLDPETVKRLPVGKDGFVKTNVKFVERGFEVTDEPITKKIVAELPWLKHYPNNPYKYGACFDTGDRELRFLGCQSFFANSNAFESQDFY